VSVELAVVPHEQRHLVVVGTALRKPANIIAAYLQSLAWQVTPRNVEFVYLFVDDGLDAEARKLVDDFVAARTGQVIVSGQGGAPDFSDQGVTHNWSDTAMARVGRCKDWILDTARQNRAEGVWLADADLIMDPMTFSSMWSVPDPIICAVYWTVWSKNPPEQQAPTHAGPQVWMTHPYTLNGNGLEEWELRRRLVDRQLTQVFGQGACTLIRRAALQKGVSFAPVSGNTGPGLMQGEDRHFCIRAELLHLRMTADPWPDIFHIYHRPEDESRISEMLIRLGEHSDFVWGSHGKLYEGGPVPKDSRPPLLGELVSLDLAALEPIHTPNGVMYPPPQLVRGRLGVVGLHPELESALLSMQRGETRIVPTHFPLSYPFPPYRGQRRLIKVTLIDHKPYGFQPVIEDEILRNEAGSWIDTTTCTPELVEQMKEVHA
jgi:hypothetical protein